MKYKKAAALLRMQGYQKTSTLHKIETWIAKGPHNIYTYNQRSNIWDMVPQYIRRPMYKTLNMLNDKSK